MITWYRSRLHVSWCLRARSYHTCCFSLPAFLRKLLAGSITTSCVLAWAV
uniref:Uncharacterized protein n=1 Tax=Anguilla anguilla TaxID=7936 RepID=A0A0E9PG09_ANGAN